MLRPIGALAALFLSTQSAFAVVYDCDITGAFKDGWIGDEIIFSIDEKEKTAAVVDPLILMVQDVPVITELEMSPGRYTMRWQLKNLPIAHSPSGERTLGRADFKAVVIKKTGKLMLRVNLRSADNMPTGEGTCIRKEK